MVIGYFGFLNASKGIDTLLQGVRIALNNKLPVKLLMIGGRTGASDPVNIVYAQEVDQMVEDLNLHDHIRWTGFVDDQAVSGHLTASDIVALPFRDGVSFRRGSLMAALAHGCAIITTYPQVDIPEIMCDECMRLIPAESPTALSIAIEDLIDNPDLREDLGRRSYELAQQFTWDHIAAQTAAYFEELLEHRS